MAIADDLPRLWEISGKNAQGVQGKLYILPVTHNGLEAEYDGYLHKTVMPVALKADAFFYEGSFLYPQYAPACPTPLEDTTENRKILRQARADVARAIENNLPPVPAAGTVSPQMHRLQVFARHQFGLSLVKTLSEYGLIAEMKINLDQTLMRRPERAPHPDIAPYIAYQRHVSGIDANESIDTNDDILDAYCLIKKNRGRYLRREIAQSDPLKFKPLSPQAIAAGEAGFVASIRQGYLAPSFVDAPDDEYSRLIVCERNERWLVRMREGLGKGVRFYALGGGHVLQPAPNQQRCDGLLTRLRNDGFTVKLVN